MLLLRLLCLPLGVLRGSACALNTCERSSWEVAVVASLTLIRLRCCFGSSSRPAPLTLQRAPADCLVAARWLPAVQRQLSRLLAELARLLPKLCLLCIFPHHAVLLLLLLLLLLILLLLQRLLLLWPRLQRIRLASLQLSLQPVSTTAVLVMCIVTAWVCPLVPSCCLGPAS